MLTALTLVPSIPQCHLIKAFQQLIQLNIREIGLFFHFLLIVPVHTVLLAWLLWRRRLVPRIIAALGLLGGPLVGAMNLAVMFGLTGPVAALALPVFAWEVGLAGHLILRGLRLPEPGSGMRRAPGADRIPDEPVGTPVGPG